MCILTKGVIGIAIFTQLLSCFSLKQVDPKDGIFLEIWFSFFLMFSVLGPTVSIQEKVNVIRAHTRNTLTWAQFAFLSR